MIYQRAPAPALQPFIQTLWTTDGGAALAQRGDSCGHRFECVLPTGAMHIVLRLSDVPVRVLRKVFSNEWQVLRRGMVGGVRATAFVREPGPASPAVGALLQPGAAPLLFGVGADELAERHTPLDELLGAAAGLLWEQLAEAATLPARLNLFEAFLAERLPVVRGLDPLVAQLLAGVRQSLSVQAAVDCSGLSHRQFIVHFRRQFGIAPKAYLRLRRFQAALRQLHADPSSTLATLALETGYSDQPHFNREFLAVTGVAPGEYRRHAPRHTHHLPLPTWPSAGQFSSRQQS